MRGRRDASTKEGNCQMVDAEDKKKNLETESRLDTTKTLQRGIQDRHPRPQDTRGCSLRSRFLTSSKNNMVKGKSESRRRAGWNHTAA